jgi:hypothetical protein
MGGVRNAAFMMGKHAKQPLGRPKQRLDDTNKTEFKATDWGVVEYIHLAQNRDQWKDLVRDSKELPDYIKRREYIG